jgi:hypothetical protein
MPTQVEEWPPKLEGVKRMYMMDERGKRYLCLHRWRNGRLNWKGVDVYDVYGRKEERVFMPTQVE